MAHEHAKAKARRAFEGRCVFRGTLGTDAMHFYPAGDFKTLADVEFNLFLGSRSLHNTPDAACFDWALNEDSVFVVRSIAERHWILRNLTLIDVRPLILTRLISLKMICAMSAIEWHEPKEPEDLNELLLGFKTRRQRQYNMEPERAREMETIQADL